MQYDDHFPINLDYYEYKYFRVSKKYTDEFNDLRNLIITASKENKAVSEDKIEKFFSLLKDVAKEEHKHYTANISTHIDDIMEYFDKGQQGYVYEDLKDVPGDEIEYYDENNQLKKGFTVEQADEGFSFMLWVVLKKILEIDKQNKKPFTKDECIEAILVQLLIYRAESLKEDRKDAYTKYKMSVIAACIAHKVFGFISSTKTMTNPKYYQFARKATENTEKNHPELFVGLNKG